MDGNCLFRSEGEKTVSNTLKDDALTQDSRLADCRGAEFTVKVAVGPKTCSRNARTIQHEMHALRLSTWRGRLMCMGPHMGPKRLLYMGTKMIIWAHI